MITLRSACLLLASATTLLAQDPPELAPVVARLARTYAEGPNGKDFFDVFNAAVELKSNGLWVRFGAPGEPPVRIDRSTGIARTIGAKGQGPNEFAGPTDLISGQDGLIGVRDPGRQLLFWVDRDGVQRRTWPVPTSSNMQYKTFTDTKGRVFIGVSSFDPKGGFGPTIIVRVDSARGLVDTMTVPFKADPRWTWETRTSSGSAMGATKYYVQYAPSPDWGIDRQGRIFGYYSDSSFVQIFDGRQTHRLLVPAWHEQLTAANRKTVTDRLDDIERREKARGGTFLGPRPPIPTMRAQILEVMPDVAGGLVVRRSKPCQGFSAWKAPVTGAAPPDSGRCGWVERFDASGKRLAPFTLTGRDQLLAVRADTVWVARRDDDDLVKILELTLPRRP
jgi:hypothetical protein